MMVPTPAAAALSSISGKSWAKSLPWICEWLSISSMVVLLFHFGCSQVAEDLLQRRDHLLVQERFRYDAAEAVALRVRHDRVVRVTARHEGLQLRVESPEVNHRL